ncbi:MAG TPA: UDP-N-acetylmuramoyl-L-alanyl-D-glutamate--2,6-diaminopimelate ligase [Haloplasmataceae bacterium]
MDLYTLLRLSKIPFTDKIVNHEVSQICDNSQEVVKDGVFIAIKGENRDGHDYILDVIKKGIKTIIYEDHYYDYINIEQVNFIKVHDTKKTFALISACFYQHPSKQMNVIGVTGTNGKTTTSTLIYNLYRLLQEKCTLIGTNGIYIGQNLKPNINTTPSAKSIQSILHESLTSGIKNVVMEVSSHARKQQRVSQLDFNTIIFTNFSQDHLDYHKTFEDYFYSKALILSSLGNYLSDKRVILNGDDKYYKRFLTFSNVENYTYGLGSHNDFQAREINCAVDNIYFHFYGFNKFLGVCNTNNLFGFFNVYNLLAVLSYFYLENYEISKVLEVIPKLQGVKGRMEKVISSSSLNVFIDYAHTPDSVFRVLKEIKMLACRRVICIIGCGGNRDPLKRPIMGKITTDLADLVIFTADNPRDEEVSDIITEMIKGTEKNNYLVIENREEAIQYAIRIMNDRDIVVILGKGHENYQIVKSEKKTFSDYEVAQKYLEIYKR